MIARKCSLCPKLISECGAYIESSGFMDRGMSAEDRSSQRDTFGSLPYELTGQCVKMQMYLRVIEELRPRIEELEAARQAMSDAELKETQCENEEARRRELERKLAGLKKSSGGGAGAAAGGQDEPASAPRETPQRRSKRHADGEEGEEEEDGQGEETENGQRQSSHQKRRRAVASDE